MTCCRPRVTKTKITELPTAVVAELEDFFETVQYNESTGEFTNRKQTLQRLVDMLSEIFVTTGVAGSNSIHGVGPPLGVVTPDAIDQFYRDTTSPGLWQSTGLTSTDWILWSGNG